VTESRAFEDHEFNVLVRDLDPQGHVANHVYVAYLSEARARFMRAFDGAEVGFKPSVVAEIRCRYLSPLLAWERFRVGVAIARVGRTSIGFAYEVRTDDRLVATGDSVEVLVDPQTRRPREVPPALRARLEQRLAQEAGHAATAVPDAGHAAATEPAGQKTRQDGIAPRA
jgi:acyl-CoA thioester hydrolase